MEVSAGEVLETLSGLFVNRGEVEEGGKGGGSGRQEVVSGDTEGLRYGKSGGTEEVDY